MTKCRYFKIQQHLNIFFLVGTQIIRRRKIELILICLEIHKLGLYGYIDLHQRKKSNFVLLYAGIKVRHHLYSV